MTQYVLRSDYEYKGRQVSSYFAGIGELIPCISSGPLDMGTYILDKPILMTENGDHEGT